MRCSLAALALLAAGPISIASRPVLAAHDKPAAAQHRQVKPGEVSAARRKRHAPRPAVQAAPARPGWRGADPTQGPGIARLRELQRQGVCVIDEGYGRWTTCNND
jgi:hypothetical protein